MALGSKRNGPGDKLGLVRFTAEKKIQSGNAKMQMNRRVWIAGVLGAVFFRPKPAAAVAVKSSDAKIAQAEFNQVKHLILAIDKSFMKTGGDWKRAAKRMASNNIDERVEQAIAWRKRRLPSN